MTTENRTIIAASLLTTIITLGIVHKRAKEKKSSRNQPLFAENKDLSTNQSVVISTSPIIAPTLWQTVYANMYNLVTWPWNKAMATYAGIKESASLAHSRYRRLKAAAEKVITASIELNAALFEFNQIYYGEIEPSLPKPEKVLTVFNFFSAIFAVLFFRNSISAAANIAVTSVTAATAIATQNPITTASVIGTCAPPLIIKAYKNKKEQDAKEKPTVISTISDTIYSSYESVRKMTGTVTRLAL